MSKERSRPPKPPLLWSGVLFAFAANLLFVNLAQRLVAALQWGLTWEALATLAAPLLVGVATAFYTRQRGGMHAFIGGMLSIPLLALATFGGAWQFAILAGAFCTLGGALTEIVLRRRSMA